MSSNNTHESRVPVVIVKPIVYGNTAKHFGSKRDSDGHTHKWTLYLRSLNNEDLSNYISRVQFRLHETYPNHIRMMNQPPFEIEESGWGEFETQITIYFVDPNEKPVTIYHHLKLFSTNPEVVSGKKPLINEYYDELIFQEPSESLVRVLNAAKVETSTSTAIEQEYAKKKAATLLQIQNARQRVRSEINELSDRLRIAQENIQRLRQRSIDQNYSPGTVIFSTQEMDQ